MCNGRLLRAGLSCKTVGWLIGAIPLLCAIGLFFSWQQDEVVLRQRALGSFLLDFGLRSVTTRIPQRMTALNTDKLEATDA
jgi:hypothetical protein